MNNKFKKEDPEIVRLFNTIITTLSHISQAYSHYFGTTFADLTDDERLVANNEIFRFHRMTTQYFLVMNFCKLFEQYRSDIEGDSSLVKLNKRLKDKYPDDFSGQFENAGLIKSIKTSPIFLHMKLLRNKSYGHAENHVLNPPMKFVFLKQHELAMFREILLSAIKIVNNCYACYDTSTGFHHFYDSSSPKNFLKSYTRNKKFWRENYLKG